MYDKILQKLKSTLKQNSSVTVKSLEAQAKLAATFITTDEMLALYDATVVIDTIEGNINHYMKVHTDKIKVAEAAAKIKKEAVAKMAQEEVKKKAADVEEGTPEWIKAIMEQNRLQAELTTKLANDISALKDDKITSGRSEELNKILKDLPEIIATPIRQSFNSTSFEGEEEFVAYLETMKSTKDSFIQKAQEDGINILTPKKEVKKIELNGQSKELHSALDLVVKQKEKTN